MPLITQDKNSVSTGDYISLSPRFDPVPFQIDGLVGRVIGSGKDQGQLTLHLGFLPIEQEQRRKIMATMYAVAMGDSPADADGGKKPKKKQPQAPADSSEASNPVPVSDPPTQTN